MTDTTAILSFLDEDDLSGPDAKFVVVTPDRAAKWLERNTHNRNVRPQTLERYKHDMLNGQWHLDGSPIRFSKDGTLLDGQHRLAAIAETGISQQMLIVVGLVAESQAVMDTGRARTAADALSMEGHSVSTGLAAAAKLAIEFERGDLSRNAEVSHSDILTYVNEHPSLGWAAETARAYARKADALPAVVAYTLYRLAKINKVQAVQFWTDAAEKVDLAAGDPALTLGYRFANARRNKERLDRRQQIALVFRAWNHRRAGNRVTAIRVGGEVPAPR